MATECLIIQGVPCVNIYSYCNSLQITETVEVSVNQITNEYFLSSDSTDPSYVRDIYATNFRVSIPTAINANLPVDIFFKEVGKLDKYYIKDVVIPASQTTYEFTVETTYVIYSNDEQVNIPDINYDVYASSQLIIPSCQGSGCTLSITSIQTTPTSSSLVSDGTITISVTGSTNVSYQLDGGVAQLGNVFTNVSSGTHSIYVQDIDDQCNDSEFVEVKEGLFQSSPLTVTAPNLYSASGNPFVIELKTAIKNATPATSRTTLSVINTATLTDNSSITISLKDPEYTITYYAKDYPVKGSYFMSNIFKDKDGNVLRNNTASHIAESILEVLEKDAVISSTYNLTSSGNNVILDSKGYSSRYDLDKNNVVIKTSTGTVSYASIDVITNNIGSEHYEGTLVSDYNLWVDCYTNADLVFGDDIIIDNLFKVKNLDLPFNTKTNSHIFNFESTVSSLVSTPKPNPFYFNTYSVPDMIKPFMFKYGERYPIAQDTYTSFKNIKGITSAIWAVNSKINITNFNDMLDYLGTTSYKKFLTNAPIYRLLHKTQRELLYLAIPKNTGKELRLIADIEYYDGVVSSNIDFGLVATPTNAGGVYIINVSWDALDLDAHVTPTSSIKELQLRVIDANSPTIPYSESIIHRYVVDEQIPTFGVMFKNALGGFDSFEFIGKATNSALRVGKEYSVPISPKAKGKVDQGFKASSAYNIAVTDEFIVNTGHVHEAVFDWLIELLASDEIYAYNSYGDMAFIVLTNYKYSKNTNDNIYNIELSFKKTYQENV